MWGVAMTPVTSPTDSDVSPDETACWLVNINSLPRPFQKDAITSNCNHSCLHVRGKRKKKRVASDSRSSNLTAA